MTAAPIENPALSVTEVNDVLAALGLDVAVHVGSVTDEVALAMGCEYAAHMMVGDERRPLLMGMEVEIASMLFGMVAALKLVRDDLAVAE